MWRPEIEPLEKQKQRLLTELNAAPAGSRRFKKLFKSYISVYELLKLYQR